MSRNLPRFRSLFSPERRSARSARWNKRFRKFSLSSWHSNRIVQGVCDLFRISAEAARVVSGATGSQFVGVGFGRVLNVEPLEERQMLSTTPWDLATANFSQNWSNTGLITVNDNWSGVPSVVGHLGDGLSASPGTDPQTVLGAGSGTVDVIANQSSTGLATGGVAEFDNTLLFDNFDSYADTAAFTASWPVVAGGGGTLSTAQASSSPNSINISATPGIQRSGKTIAETSTLASSGNLGIGDQVIFSFDFYDEAPAIAPYRQFSNLQDTAAPTLTNQLVSMGLNNNQTAGENGGQRYMARILGYDPANDNLGAETGGDGIASYFKLNDFGAAGQRSLGWHNLKVIISTDDGLSTDYAFYVDNVLAETVLNVGTAATIRSYDNVRLGSGVTATNQAYFDNMNVQVIPAAFNPVVALQGSGTADAPFLNLHMNSSGRQNVTVSYNLRDIDGSADNSIQPVALQYRIGGSGSYTNVPSAFVADASGGPSQATLVTAVSASLPEWNNVSNLQFRIITSDAAMPDEWIGIDDIVVSSTPVTTTYIDDDWALFTPGQIITDADPNTPGNQRAEFGFDAFSSVQAGINALGASGTVNVRAGAYTGNINTTSKSVVLAAGASPGQVVVNGDLTLDGNDTLPIEINGLSAATDYDNFIVNGAVTLGGATLSVSGTLIPAIGSSFTIIDNDTNSDAVSGIFFGLDEGDTIALNNIPLTVSYVGGDLNNVTLTVEAPGEAWVDNDWVITSDVGPGGLSYGDVVESDADDGDASVTGKVFGYNAFDTITNGIATVESAGTVYVLAGTFTGDVNINKSLTLRGNQFGVNPNDGSWNDTRIAAAETIIHGAMNLSHNNDIVVDGFTFERTATNEGHVLIGSGNPMGVGATSSFDLKNNRFVGTRNGGSVWAGIHTNFNNDTGGLLPGNKFTADQNRFQISGTGSGAGILVNANRPGSDGLGSTTITDNYVTNSPSNGLNVNRPGAFLTLTGNHLVNDDIFTFQVHNGLIDGNTVINSPQGSIQVVASSFEDFSDVTVSNNTIINNVSLLTNNFSQIDVRGPSSGTNVVTGNSVTLTGAIPGGLAGIYGVRVRGTSATGVGNLTVSNNSLNGGGVGGAGTAALPPTSGVFVDTDLLTSGLDLHVENNFVNGWVNAVTVWDTNNAGPGALGNLPIGATFELFNNDLSGNSGLGVASGAGELVNASGNWWGTSAAAGVAAEGTAGAVDYTGWLEVGTDVGGNPLNGFQGDLSVIIVDDDSPQSGSVGRINEGIAIVDAGGTVKILPGTYAENVDATSNAVTLSPGASPAQVTVNGNLTLDDDDELAIEINGLSAATQYDNFIVNGVVTLDDATLALSGTLFPSIGNSFTIIDNDLSDAVGGTFDGLDEGDTISLNGMPLTVSYVSGAGTNNITLTVVPPDDVWVDNDWVVTTDVGPAGLSMGDTVASDADDGDDPVAGKIFGYDAYATITPAVAAVANLGTINVLAGTYNEAVAITSKSVDVLGQGASDVTLNGGPTSTPLSVSGSSTVLVDGLTIAGGIFGVDLDAATVTLSNVVITGGSAIGVLVDNNATATIEDSLLDGPGSGTGVAAIDGSVTVTRSILTDRTDGVVVGAAGSATLHNNDLSDAFGSFAIQANPSAGVIDASGNWWGVTDENLVAAKVLGSIDFTPYLASATNNATGVGFDGDFSYLHVTVQGSQHSSGGGRIQEGVDLIDDGSFIGGNRIVDVHAGTYIEQVIIDKSLQLLGANAAADPTDGGARGAETIIRPSVSGPSPYSGQVHSTIVTLLASDVTIKGLLLDGENTALPGGVALTGTASLADAMTAIGSIDSAAQPGVDISVYGNVTTYAPISGITIDNNIIRNTSYQGIDIGFASSSGASGNSFIRNNLIQNIGADADYNDEGTGIRLYNSFYAQVTDNDLENVRMGVETGNFHLANPGTPGDISGNEISARRRGIFYNLFSPASSAFTVDDNAITAVNTTGTWNGIYILSQSGAVTTFSGNTVDGSGAGGLSAGITVWAATPGRVVIEGGGGTISGVDYGVWAANIAPVFGFPDSATDVTVSGASITADIYGVYVQDTASEDVTVNVTDDTSITTGGAGTGIFVSGNDASATITGNLLSIHGNTIGIDVNGGAATITNNHIYDNTTGIRLTNLGSATVNNNDFEGGSFDNGTDLRIDADADSLGIIGGVMTGNTFAGTTYIDQRDDQDLTALRSPFGTNFYNVGGVATTNDFVIESRIFHQVDNAASGLVTWVPNTIFVSSVDETGTTPTAADNDYTRIKNAVEAAGDGYFIELLGSGANAFDWTETFAAASWALGNDGVASTADDYSVLVPIGLDSVTFTASGGFGNATILGPDEQVGHAGGVLAFRNGPNVGWTISDLDIRNFENAIGFFFGAGGVHAYDNTTIDNNYILVASDFHAGIDSTANDDIEPGAGKDVNVAIHYSFGDNITISNNTIEFPGTGASNSGGGQFANSQGILSDTSGAAYEGLQITGNILNVLGAQSGDPEVIFGIWENGHAHTKNITVSGNEFHNLSLGNDPTLNLQRAFRVTSHSGASSTVTYSDNIVDGANIGWQWLAGQNFAGNQPVEVTGNMLTNVNTGFLVQSNGLAHFSDNSLANSGAMAGLGIGIDVRSGSIVTIDDSIDDNEISGFATGIKSAGAVTVEDNDASIHGNAIGIDVTGGTATISGNHIYDNTTAGIRFTTGGGGSVTGNDFNDAVVDAGEDNGTDLQLTSTAGTVTIGAGNDFAGDAFFIDNATTQSYDLSSNGTTFDESNNFRIEDKMHHRMDTDLTVTVGRVTWVANNVYVTDAGTDHNIQRGVDTAEATWIVNLEAGTYDDDDLTVQIAKSITVRGPNALISPNTGVRVAEAVITNQGTSISPNTVFSINGSGLTVTVEGVKFDGTPSAMNAYSQNDTINLLKNIFSNTHDPGMYFETPILTIDDNRFENITTQGEDTIQVGTVGSGRAPLTITNNVWTNVTTAALNLSDVSGTISGNEFINVAYYGILVAFDSGNLSITGNLFDGITNPDQVNVPTWGAGVRFYSPTIVDPVNVTGNTFQNSYNGVSIRRTDDNPGPGIADISGMPINVTGNTFTNNIQAIYHDGRGTLDVSAGNIYDGVNSLGAATAQLYNIVDNIRDGIDQDDRGLVLLKTGHVYVTPGSFAAPDPAADIQRAVDLAITGDIVHIEGGSYTGDVSTAGKSVTLNLGASTAQVTINGNLTLDSDDTLSLEINGTSPTFTPGTDYDQIAVNGMVTLGGASLVIDPSSSISASPGESVRIVDNDLADAVAGTFSGQPNGSTLVVNGGLFQIFYDGGDGNDVVLVKVPAGPPPSVVFVNDDWSIYSNGTDADFVDDGMDGVPASYNAAWGPGLNGSAIGYDQFDTIQEAISAVAAGGTIYVYSGAYAENLSVNKSVSLLGANNLIDGDGVRTSESIIHANGNTSGVVTVTADDVTISGFTVSGDDPLTVGQPVHSGSDANALYAITNGNTGAGAAINGLTVRDNIIERAALGILGNGISGPSTTSVIDANLFQDLGVFDFGYAVSLRNNFYADVTDNVMRRVYTGVHVNNFSTAKGSPWLMQGNDIESYAAGLWHNQAYSAATSMTLDDNDFKQSAGPAVANNIGILVTLGPGGVAPTVTNNTIDDHDYGMVVWGTPGGLTLGSTNSISDADVGVFVTNNVGFNPIGTTSLGPVASGAAITLDGATITNSTTGVSVFGDVAGGPVAATLQNGVSISGGTTGVLVSGPQAVATITGNNITDNTVGIQFVNSGSTGVGSVADNDFDGGAGDDNGTDLLLSSSAGTVTIDADNDFAGDLYFIDNQTTQSYDLSSNGTTFDESDNFRIEDKMHHRMDIDLAVTNGRITWVADNVYVTTPGGGSTDSDIQRGINAADVGDTVNVEAGTYTNEAQILVNKDLTIIGDDKTTTIFTKNFNTGGSGDARGWWLVDTGVTLDLSEVGFDGAGFLTHQAIRHKGDGGTIDNVAFTEIKYQESGPAYAGFGVAFLPAGGGDLDITNSMFSEIGRVGAIYFGALVTGRFADNAYTGKGAGDWIDYAVEVGAGAVVDIEDNNISGNLGTALGDGSTSAGVLVTTFFGGGSEAHLSGNTIDNNTTGVFVGFNNADTSVVTISGDIITNNTASGVFVIGGSVTVQNDTTLTGNGTGITVGDGGEATIVDNDDSITDNDIGIDVDGGTALIQNNDLNDNTIGVLIQNGGLVDLGQNGPGSNFTGLGISTGGNDFSLYMAAASSTSGAIVNLNTNGANANPGPQDVPPDVPAFANLWDDPSLSGIENVIWHDADDTALGFIDYGSLANLVVSLDPLPSDVDHEDMDEGGSVTVYGEFTNDAQAHTVTVSWSDGSPDSVVNLGAGVFTFAISSPAGVTYTDDPNGGIQFILRNITVTVEEDANPGNFLTDASLSVDVNNVVPVVPLADQDGDNEIDEGQTFNLVVGPRIDPGADTITAYTIFWGDGNSTFVSGDPLTSAAVHSHLYADGVNPPTRTITIDVLDDDGTWMSVGSLTIDVNNVNPTAVNFQAFNSTVNEGSTTTVFFSGPFTDPGSPDSPFHFSYDFNGNGVYGEAGELGDGTYGGSGAASSATVPAQFLADDDDSPRTVKARIIDNDGGFTEYSASIVINNVAPVVNAGADATAFAGVLFTHSISFTDPGTDAPWTVNVDWNGDGDFLDTDEAAFNVNLHTFNISHTYLASDIGFTYNVLVQVNDNDGGLDSDVFQVTVVEDTLRVIDFQTFASGFDVTFNRAIDLDDINLYDGPDVALDPADLTVVGASVGAVKGSLVWNAATNTMSWVKTGGVLSADTYTVTLQSDVLGFEDTLGNLLDGDGDFNDSEVNDDYVDSFIVAPSSAVVVSVRDFARGAGQHVDDLPAAPQLDLAVRIDNPIGVTALDFDVHFDPALLTMGAPTLAPGLPPGWSITFNNSVPGILEVTASGTTPLNASHTRVVLLDADVSASAPYGASQVIRLVNVQVNEDAIASKADYAVHKAVFLGDADGDGVYLGNDASLISNVVVNNNSGFDAHQWTDPVIVADATGNGALSGQDASLVAQEAALIDTVEIPALPPGPPPVSVTGGIDPELSVPQRFAAPGDTVTIPVYIKVLAGEAADPKVRSATFDVFFDEADLDITVADVQQGSFWTTANFWSMSVNDLSGRTRIVYFNSNAQVSDPTAQGEIALLTYTVSGSLAPGDFVTLNIEPASATEGGLTWTNVDGAIGVTYTADFDTDGDVDGDDLGDWQAGYGTQPNAPIAAGDADRDGAVTGNDFLLWQQQLGSSVFPIIPSATSSGALAAMEIADLAEEPIADSMAAYVAPASVTSSWWLDFNAGREADSRKASAGRDRVDAAFDDWTRRAADSTHSGEWAPRFESLAFDSALEDEDEQFCEEFEIDTTLEEVSDEALLAWLDN